MFNLGEICFTVKIQPEKIGKEGPLLIHFDGWGDENDYWSETDSEDLHPIGFMETYGHLRILGVPQLQPPHGRRI